MAIDVYCFIKLFDQRRELRGLLSEKYDNDRIYGLPMEWALWFFWKKHFDYFEAYLVDTWNEQLTRYENRFVGFLKEKGPTFIMDKAMARRDGIFPF